MVAGEASRRPPTPEDPNTLVVNVVHKQPLPSIIKTTKQVIQAKKPEPPKWRTEHPYSKDFVPIASTDAAIAAGKNLKTYSASCFCGRVHYSVRGDPVSSKICHCTGCQLLHGAPCEWVAMFAKDNVKFDPKSLDYLYFYNSETDIGLSAKHGDQREGPCKVSCSHCRTPIGDEGKNMWLAFCTLFGFSEEDSIPRAFRPTCHLFYKQRCLNVPDRKTKWEGQKKLSNKWHSEWEE